MLGARTSSFSPSDRSDVPSGTYLSLGPRTNLALSTGQSCQNPIEATGLRLPVRLCCPLRYVASMLVSESLFLPLVRDYGGRIALLHATTGPDRASLGQSRTLASGISDHSAVLARGSPIQFSVTASHHGFTVRYSLLVCLRPIGFRSAPDTPHYWLSHLNGVVQEQDFHLQGSTLSHATRAG